MAIISITKQDLSLRISSVTESNQRDQSGLRYDGSPEVQTSLLIMHNYEQLTAVRWKVDCQTETKSGLENHLYADPIPDSSEYVNILRSTNILYKNVRSLIAAADRIYREDIERRVASDGRAVDISMPVRFSSSILDLAELVEVAETELFQLQSKINQLASDAEFEVSTVYEATSRSALNHTRDLVDIAELYIHAHIWLSWTFESLFQIRQIHHLITETDRYDKFDSDDITFIAHPPIMVTTIACTALIEEIGGHYINYCSEKSINMDNTSSSAVLEDIEQVYDKSSEFDWGGIEAVLIETRDNLVHYIKSRQQSLNAEDFEQYSELVMETIRLSRSLVESMATEALKEYVTDVIATGIKHSTDKPIRQQWIRFSDGE